MVEIRKNSYTSYNCSTYTSSSCSSYSLSGYIPYSDGANVGDVYNSTALEIFTAPQPTHVAAAHDAEAGPSGVREARRSVSPSARSRSPPHSLTKQEVIGRGPGFRVILYSSSSGDDDDDDDDADQAYDGDDDGIDDEDPESPECYGKEDHRTAFVPQ